MINVIIDQEGCIRCGQCWESCPEFFVDNAEAGYSQVASKYRIAGKQNEGVVFEDCEEGMKKAAEDCPAHVIHIGPPAQGFDPV